MKYALITEDQIKALKNAIDGAYCSPALIDAWDILKSLKAKEPSMVSSTSNKSFAMYTIEIPFVGKQP